MANGPIFIAGISRCGKSMMQICLQLHPNISISAIGAWTYFYDKYGDLGQRNNFERCLEAMLHCKPTRFLNLDPNHIRQAFWQGEPTYARLFAIFQQYYAEQEGKPRWGDQGELIEHYADLIFAAYPTAKMIHMIRDPRDRYETSQARWQQGKGGAGGATAMWLYSIRLAQRNLKRYPDRYKIVPYETFVSQPEETLQSVCDFLGEDYTPAMLPPARELGYQDKRSDGLKSRLGLTSFSTEYIGRFRERVPKREIAFIQAYAKQDMAVYSYDLEPTPFSLSDHLLFYLVDWPTNLVRMAAWYATVSIFPSKMGRTPRFRKQNEGVV